MSYYVIIPDRVRYDKRLSAMEKIMYGEIVALSKKHGYCFASNNYFADLYDVTVTSVSRWINNLVSYGYFRAEYDIADGFASSTRKLYIEDEFIYPVGSEDIEVPDNYEKTKVVNEDIDHIVSYLNEVCGSRFKSNTSNTVRCIKSRLKEGFSLQDFEKVIRWKYYQWGEKPFRFSSGQLSSDYLRPATLFGNNFESYLYEANNNTNHNSEAIRSVPPDEERSELVF